MPKVRVHLRLSPYPPRRDPATYLTLKALSSDTSIREPCFIPERYLALKKIVRPLPSEYPHAYLKLKTLRNPRSAPI